MTEFLPRSNRPGSPVERIALAKSVMQQMFEALDAAFNSLDEYQREIVQTKYGWRWVDGILETPPPRKTVETFKKLQDRGFPHSQEKFYDDLHKIRATVKAYVSSLGKSTLNQVSGMMPRTKKTPRVGDEDFEKVKIYLKLDELQQKDSAETANGQQVKDSKMI